MSKFMRLNFFLVFTFLFGALLAACVPEARNNNVNQPTATEILVFANEAAVSAYTYNFIEYRNNLQTASHYFTPQGWKAFQQALVNSGNLKATIKRKLVVSAVATGAPVILDQGLKEGRDTWVVQMPMLVTYQSAYHAARQNIIVKLTIVKTQQNMGVRGLGVASFITQ